VRGTLFAQYLDDLLKHIVRAQQCVVIPESQHMKICSAQIPRALFVISSLISMLTAIKLDDESVFDTAEVRVIPSHRMLATELHPKLCRTQPRPQLALGIGLVAAKLLCSFHESPISW
jgi:hypothetical protein